MTLKIRGKLILSFLLVILVMDGTLYGYLLPVLNRSQLNTILGSSFAIATLVALVLSCLLSSSASRSLRAIAAAAGQIGMGEFNRKIPVRARDEVGELAEAMNDMGGRVERQLSTLASEKNRLDTILRGMGEGVIVTDAAGIITLVNPAFRALFAIMEEVEGKPLIDFNRHPVLHDAYNLVVTTRSELLEEIVLALDVEKTILTHWVPLLSNGGIHGVVAVFHDISDLKRLEKIRRDFVANVSHELRTPVAVIKGYAEALLTGAPEMEPERIGRFIEIIHSHSERLANLIGDLLSLSALESGDLSLELVPLSIAGAARHASSLLEQKARNKEITISWNGVEGVPPVMIDNGRIEQVLINLLDNAIKYTPENGSITIGARDSGTMVTIAITDTGEGIPPNDLPRIFERFYRVDSARDRKQGGTGLGLSIVKHIVQLHGGTVAVESTPGKGSTFSFTLKKA